MSDSRSNANDPKQLQPLQRPQAPEIKINTDLNEEFSPTAVHPTLQISSENAYSNDTSALLTSGSVSPVDGPSGGSIRSFTSDPRDHESRPTSPHNVSSPAHKMNDSVSHSNYLAVPGTRSRGNSLESEDTHQSSSTYGGDTYVPTASHGSRAELTKNMVINDEDALKPDPGREDEFTVENNKFAFSPGQLNKLLNPKNLGAFHALGGLRGLEKGLRTDINSGLSMDETTLDGTVSFEDATSIASEETTQESTPQSPQQPTRSGTEPTKQPDDGYSDRKRVYGTNKLPERKPKSIFELAWIAYNDKVLILLTVAAIISLALGIYQSVTAKPGEPKVEWVEGVAIIVAIVIVVIVGAANDWQKERQFVKLNKKKDDRQVKVVRSGKILEIPIYDVLVGDVMHLEPGDVIPVDGIFISGHDVKCDESSATGESDVLRKAAGDEVSRAIKRGENVVKQDPFIVSGAKVSEGVGTFIVTAVGVHSTYGKTMMSLQDEGQTTPLQSKLNVLAEYIAKLGLAAGLLLFVVLFIKFLAQLKSIDGADEKGQAFLKIFIVAVTVIVVAVPEGLPLAVTLALAFATTRMLKDNNLVRLLRACETMGNATTICSDKTGTLTENKMTAVAATVGTTFQFVKDAGASPNGPAEVENGGVPKASAALSPSEFAKNLSAPAKQLLIDSIVLNSTAFEGEQEGVMTFIGSKTETALLGFARTYLALGSLSEARSNAEIAQMVPFDSGRKCMAVVIKMGPGKYRMLVKGAAEILVAKSTRIISDPTQGLSDRLMSDDAKEALNTMIDRYAAKSLRAISLAYRDFSQWPPEGVRKQDKDRSLADFDAVFMDMTMFAVFGIQDPLRAGVTESVKQCQKAGVFVRMVTGDNINTAKAIAGECGIFTPGGVAIEGPAFRQLSSAKIRQLIPRLQVLARSSPDDKKTLVTHLKKLGETVAVTGDGTNDAQALKTADVGFSMGIAGTEVAKEASDIILMDDNFTSIIKAMAWGRTVNDAVKKFLQFQITVNITAVLLTFISAVASDNEDSVLTAVQLLWVNLIMDTFAALALATDPPSPHVLDRRPEPKSAPLITLTMWKMIIGQSIYQMAVTLVLNFAGGHFGYEGEVLSTVVFNAFVWMQIFNQWNSRRLDNGFNIFEGMLRNWWFLGIQFIIMGGQVLIIFVGGHAFSVTRINGAQWGVCLIIGVVSLPIGVIIRLIPDALIEKLIPTFFTRKKGPELRVSDEEDRFEWNPALTEIRDQLKFLKRVRGGRLRHLKDKLQHPEQLLPRSRSGSRSSRSRENSVPGTPVNEQSNTPSQPPSPESRSRRRARSRSNSAFGPATAMAGIVAGSIAGWSPIERAPPDGEPFKFDFTSRQGLDNQQGIEIHPNTAADDRIVGDYLSSSKTPPSQNPDLLPYFEHAPPARAPSSRSMRSTSAHSRSAHSRSASRNES